MRSVGRTLLCVCIARSIHPSFVQIKLSLQCRMLDPMHNLTVEHTVVLPRPLPLPHHRQPNLRLRRLHQNRPSWRFHCM